MYLGLISEKLDEWIKNNIFCVVHNIFHSLSSFFIFFLLFSNTQDAHSILVRPAADVVQSGKLEDVNHDVQLYSADDQVLDLSLASRSSPGSPPATFLQDSPGVLRPSWTALQPTPSCFFPLLIQIGRVVGPKAPRIGTLLRHTHFESSLESVDLAYPWSAPS